MIDYVGYLGADGNPYPYTSTDGQQYGYQVPEQLVRQVVAAEKAHREACDNVRAWVTTYQLPLIDLDSGEEVDEDEL